MKDQYFGDRHDFYKYDLLLYLMGSRLDLEQLLFAVMLTPADDSDHGDFISYAAENRNSDLCTWLQERVAKGERDVAQLSRYPVFRDATWRFNQVLETVPMDSEGRAAYFRAVETALAPRTLLFLDPDNGFMPKKPVRAKRPKYVDYLEVVQLFEALDEQSLLVVYQHHPHKLWETCRAAVLQQLAGLGCAPNAAWISPDNLVAYLILARSGRRLEEVHDVLAPYMDGNHFRYPPREEARSL